MHAKRLLAGAIAIAALVAAQSPIDDALARIRVEVDRMRADRDRLAAEVGELREERDGLMADLVRYQKVAASQQTSLVTASHLGAVDAITRTLGGTPGFTGGATLSGYLDARLVEAKAAAVAAAAKLAQPPPPPPPPAPSLLGTRYLRIILPDGSTGADLDRVRDATTAWLAQRGFSVYLRDRAAALQLDPPEPAIDTGWIRESSGIGFVEFGLAPAEGATSYADPWQPLIDHIGRTRVLAIKAN